jgi:tryptophan-rich sensory protein
MSRSRLVLGLVGWLVLAFTAAAAGAIASVNAREFYAQLVRPTWAPPGAVFGPVWSVLYTLMGVAAWLVWKERGAAAAKGALSMFVAQLVANALWSWLFFAWRLGAVAFAEILVLWVMILCTVLLFWSRNRLAGALLIPYLAWVTFATALCFVTWRMNPSLL